MSENRRDQRGGGPSESTESPGAGEARDPAETEEERIARRFAEDLIARGEAVEEGAPLSRGATHEVIRERAGSGGPGKAPVVRRRRYSAF